MAHHVGLDIGVRVDQRMPHPRLRRQVHDPGRCRVVANQIADRFPVRDVQRGGTRSRDARCSRSSRACFSRDIVVVVQAVDADDRSPRASSAAATCEPMNPAAPVTQDLHVRALTWPPGLERPRDQPILQQFQHRVAERDVAFLDPRGFRCRAPAGRGRTGPAPARRRRRAGRR